jgi:hypothetical protein
MQCCNAVQLGWFTQGADQAPPTPTRLENARRLVPDRASAYNADRLFVHLETHQPVERIVALPHPL